MHNRKIKLDMYMYLAFCRKSASTVIVDKYDPSSNLYGTTENKIIILRGEKLNYNNCTSLLLRKSINLLFWAPEVQWALKVSRVCSIHVFFKCFEPRPYLICHVTTIENV